MRQTQYLSIINSGPLIIARIPWPIPKWNKVLKALTKIMHSHGRLQKDISAIEALTVNPDANETNEHPFYIKATVEVLPKLEKAFNGDFKHFKNFWLYDYTNDEFKLARKKDQTSS